MIASPLSKPNHQILCRWELCTQPRRRRRRIDKFREIVWERVNRAKSAFFMGYDQLISIREKKRNTEFNLCLSWMLMLWPLLLLLFCNSFLDVSMNDVEEEEEEQEIAHSSIFILLCWKSVSMYVVLCFCLFFFLISFHSDWISLFVEFLHFCNIFILFSTLSILYSVCIVRHAHARTPRHTYTQSTHTNHWTHNSDSCLG